MKIVFVSAGTSESSQSALLGQRLAAVMAAEAPQMVASHVVLRDYGQEMLSALTSFAPERLRSVYETVAEADAVVLVTPILNASFSGLAKLFLDVLPEGALAGKPVLMGATGGTQRHSLALDFALRPVLSYLRAQVLPTTVFVATSDWGGADNVRPVDERIAQAAREFLAAASGSVDGPPGARPAPRSPRAGRSSLGTTVASPDEAGLAAAVADDDATGSRPETTDSSGASAASPMGSFDVSRITERLSKL